MIRPELVCIGASAGGVSALQKILTGFKTSISVPIVVVQHMAESSRINLDMVFGTSFNGLLKEPIDKEVVMPGTVYFAPSGYHLLLEKDLSLSLSQDEPINFARPSIDVFMESAALALGPKVCGVLLTGASSDGAIGMKEIKAAGGYTIVQDPQTAEIKMMPQSALDIMDPDRILRLEEIPAEIQKLLLGNI
jgi:two-component system chemotaxis response regulator CheB